MNVYSNSFYCARNHERDEVIINFMQHRPDPLNLQNNQEQMTSEIVAGVVLNEKSAKNLVEILSNLLSSSKDEE